MNWFPKRNKEQMDSLYDFEGRCTVCHKSLKLLLTRKTNYKLELEVVPCLLHPEESYILWPQRDDIEIKEHVG